MDFSFQASSRISNDWVLLKMLRDPSRKWRVDVFGQAPGEQEWRQLFSKIVGLPGVPNESMELMERVDGRWL
jgi:hypothetical protein